MAKYLTLSGLATVWGKIKSNFVAQEEGKGLSTNDFTDAYKTQLENLVTTGGDANVIETITVGGTAVEVTDKTVALGTLAGLDEVAYDNLASALQAIISGKADAATTLAGYGITDGMTATEIASAIAEAVAGADHLKRKIVTSTADIDLTAEDVGQYIYMVANTNGESGNLYDEYMVLDGVLEKVGAWEVDLSDYVKTSDIEEITDDEIEATCVY